MDDFYIEQIVEKATDIKDKALNALWIVLAIILLGFGVVSGYAVAILLGLIVGALGYVFVLPTLNTEYEYLYLSKELSIDYIYNKEKRKKGKSFSLSSLEVFAPEGSDALKEFETRITKHYDFSSKTKNKKYVLIINDKGYIRITFEPNEELIKAIGNHFPRQTKSF